MKCGNRKLISKNASGYSGGINNSFQTLAGAGIKGGAGTYLLAAFGAVPPGVPTAPTRTTRNCSARATCQPPKLPAAVLRQTCDENAEPALAISRATSIMTFASIPASLAANSGVYCAYCSFKSAMKLWNVCGRSGCSSRKYSSQFTHRSEERRV